MKPDFKTEKITAFIKKHIGILFAVMIVITLVPLAIGTGYTYLCADDFSYEGGILPILEEYGTPLRAAIAATIRMNYVEQGTHLANFLIHYVRAYSRWGMQGFHVVMLLHSVFFFWAAYFLVTSVIRDKKASLGIFACFCAAVLMMPGTGNNMELFFWYTGAFNYTLEMALSFLTLGLCVRLFECDERKKRIRFQIPIAILAVLSCWGTLEVTGFFCATLFGFTVFNIDKVKKNLTLALPFVFAMIGAIVNLQAPGNFMRADLEEIEGHVTMLDGIRDAFSYFGKSTQFLFGQRLFVLLLLFVFLISMLLGIKLYNRKLKPWQMLLVIALGFLVIYATILPVTYGEHQANMKAHRTTATYRIIARSVYIFYTVSIAQWVRENLDKVQKKVTCAVLVFAAIFLLINITAVPEEFKKGFSYNIAADFYRGNLQRVYTARIYIITSMELAEDGTDFYLPVRAQLDNRCMYPMGLQEETGDIVNVSAAHLFGLNSVSIVYTD